MINYDRTVGPIVLNSEIIIQCISIFLIFPSLFHLNLTLIQNIVKLSYLLQGSKHLFT